MISCPSCSSANPVGNRYCGTCAAPLSRGPVSQTPTEAVTYSSPPSSSTEEGRFVPGTLLAGRYRIVGPVGKGGMGEVYRASDLLLGQPVALKFLPEETARSQRLLERFHQEARIARQVSHPNVCRVYDIGQADGLNFLSMEYVDGEDLGSLLRRIGRLPQDKAIEIARKLCAGLAAAHEKGVLHRDLKPANVLIDGRGNVLITDFGLAAVAGEIHAGDIRSGTPQYMAPEQLAGKEVSVRSDIYSLGLVLYEMFTGRRAFEAVSGVELARLQEESSPASLTTLVRDIDPAVERVILRCLKSDPKLRPASALAVAAALPGGDPLAAALAAGETPSPAMVADAGEHEGMKPAAAVACLAGCLAAMAAIAYLSGMWGILNLTPFEKPPAVLTVEAQEMVRSFGYPGKPADEAHGYYYDGDYLRYLQAEDASPDRWKRLASGRPPAVRFWYRESPRYLEAENFFENGLGGGRVGFNNPDFDVGGMVRLELDSHGNLIRFETVPAQVEKTPGEAKPFDWSRLLAAGGFNAASLKPAQPEWVPRSPFDARAAWTTSHEGMPGGSVRIEAAAWRGRPVYFYVIGPWTRPYRDQPAPRGTAQKAGETMLAGLFVLGGAGACLLARRNLRLGRGDRSGASRIALLALLLQMVSWALTADHVPSLGETGLLVMALCFAMFLAGLTWVLYLALEPYVRRRWPQTVVSWSRLLGYRLKDPKVGRDVMIGILLGCTWVLVFWIRNLVSRPYGDIPMAPRLEYLLGLRQQLGTMLGLIPTSVAAALLFYFLIFALRAALRREWLAGTAFVLLMTLIRALTGGVPVADLVVGPVIYTVLVVVLLRDGLLALIVGIVVADLLASAPVTLNPNEWFASHSLIFLLAVLAAAIYGFRVALAGRPLFTDDPFER